MKRLACLTLAAVSGGMALFNPTDARASTLLAENWSTNPQPSGGKLDQFTIGTPSVSTGTDTSGITFGTYQYAGQSDSYTSPTGSSNGAYLNDSETGGTAGSNTLTYDAGSIAPLTKYILSADAIHSAADGNGLTGVGTLTVELFNGSTLLSSTSIDESTITEGAGQTISTTYSTLTNLTGDISAVLVFADPDRSYQTWAGDVSLTASTVPEPATAGILMLALPLALRRCRKAAR